MALLNSSPLLSSIYIGGGTPSVLDVECLNQLIACIFHHFRVKENVEFTVELNPDDVTCQLIDCLKNNRVNRISLGIQSFTDHHLKRLRRRHTAEQAIQAVKLIHKQGIENISIDLIYGLPSQTLDEWNYDVDQALRLPIKHLSAYSLMYEEGTPLTMMRDKNEVTEADEQLSFKMYKSLCNKLKDANFIHYEISNFCLPGMHSRHNSGYWNALPYIGIGAGAHSFDGSSRYYNVEDIDAYISSPSSPPRNYEHLTPNERINEYFFTRLRTQEGINLEELKEKFGEKPLNHIMKFAQKHIQSKNLTLSNQQLSLTEEGIFLSDDVMSDLMLVE